MRRALVLAALLACVACTARTPEQTLAAAAKGVELPRVAHAPGAVPEGARYVVLAKGELRIADDPFPVARLPADGAKGFALDDKPATRDDRLVVPLDHALAWQSPNTVVLVADDTTPYRAAVEVLTTALHAKATTLAFAARDARRAVSVPIYVPSLRGRFADSTLLGVWIGKRGVSVRLNVEVLAKGCDARGEEPTFPGALDAKSLGECVARLVHGHAQLADRVAFVGADEDAPLGEVVAAMDVLTSAGFGYVGLDTSRGDALIPGLRGALK